MIPFFALLINLLLFAIFAVILWWVLGIVAGAVGIPGQIMQIVRAIIVLMMLIYFLGAVFGNFPLIWRPMN